MSANKDKVLKEQYERGLRARHVLRAGGPMFEEREKQIVDELVGFFRSKPWDQNTAIRYIAALSENRANFEELKHRARKGEDASQSLFGGESTAG